MATKLALGLDTNHNVTFELPISNVKYWTTLAANTPQQITVPANVDSVFFSFSSGTDVWVNYGASATLPGSSFATTTEELNPVARYGISEGEIISCISDSTAYVGITFFSRNIQTS